MAIALDASTPAAVSQTSGTTTTVATGTFTPTGLTAGTVTVTNNATSGNRHSRLVVLVLTGVDLSTPLITQAESSDTGGGLSNHTYTTAATNSWTVLQVSDWDVSGTTFTPDAATTVVDSQTVASSINSATLRNANLVPSGSTMALALTSPTSTRWNYVYVEVNPGNDNLILACWTGNSQAAAPTAPSIATTIAGASFTLSNYRSENDVGGLEGQCAIWYYAYAGTPTAAGNTPRIFSVAPFQRPGLYPVSEPLQLLGDASGEQFPALAETTAAADVLLVSPDVPLPETASVADTATVDVAFPLAETATATDADDLAVTVSAPLTETAVGTDILSVQVAATVSPIQALSMVPLSALFATPGLKPAAQPLQLLGDTTSPNVLAVELSDDGTGTDDLTGTATAPLGETATGTDSATIAAAIPLTETGAGTDSLSVTVGTGIDAYQASPSIAWMFTSPRASTQQTVGDTNSGPTVTDTASGTDALVVLPAVPLTETATGADAISPVAVTAPLPETATVDDSISISVTVALDDTATSADSLLVQSDTTSDPLQYHSAVPPMALSPHVAAGQVYGDATSEAAPVNLAESATADDSISITVTITLADTATATDSMVAVAGPLLEELVSAADALAISVVLSLSETATYADDMFIGGSGIQGNVRPRPDGSAGGQGRPRRSGQIIGSVG